MEQWWNDNNRGKPRYSEQNLSRCATVHHKLHEGPGLKTRSPGRKAARVPALAMVMQCHDKCVLAFRNLLACIIRADGGNVFSRNVGTQLPDYA